MIKAWADWRRLFVFGAVLIAAMTEGASALAQDATARGRYLATAANCQTCHTRSGGKPYEGGLPFTTDFGVIYSTNITSHPQAGIAVGRWRNLCGRFVRA